MLRHLETLAQRIATPVKRSAHTTRSVTISVYRARSDLESR
ncbi:Protein of unknown function [Pyronema omphalodes CBS 100304]|uniref:Uncharacterized protein n=1 Tax=Pyronema omphalodes (strain CBS 100304) TaxID=1076935 RepID=U4KU92_PYROM|nr:Protein of unknown function [Pyronema omphalodes CBS 100304]